MEQSNQMAKQHYEPIMTMIEEDESRLEEDLKLSNLTIASDQNTINQQANIRLLSYQKEKQNSGGKYQSSDINENENKNSSLFMEASVEQNRFLYRNMSEKSRFTKTGDSELRGSVIEKCIESYQYLIKKGIMTNLVYLHSGLSAYQKGALKTFKDMYKGLDQYRKEKLVSIHVIQPSKYLKIRILVANKCVDETAKQAFRILKQYKKICDFVEYLRLNDKDRTMYIKFIKSLPPQISEIFQSELRQQQKDFPELTELTMSIIQPSTQDTLIEPQFIKKYAQATFLQSNDSDSHSTVDGDSQNLAEINSHDIIGRNLKHFYREQILEGNEESKTHSNEQIQNVNVPKIFLQIYDYFDINESRLKTREIFKKQDIEKLQLVDNLEQHIALGDYNFIFTIEDPTIVGCFFKSILKYMEEPLCTNRGYKKFKKVCEKLYSDPPETILSQIRSIISEMQPVYQETWKLILHFLFLLSEHHLTNKLTIKSIATIFSDILFRPSEFTSNDMIMWRMFTDLLCLMIRDNHKIFQVLPSNHQDGIIESNSQRSISVAIRTESVVSIADKTVQMISVASDELISAHASLLDKPDHEQEILKQNQSVINQQKQSSNLQIQDVDLQTN
eukprot:403335230